jgi:hypothetical protein
MKTNLIGQDAEYWGGEGVGRPKGREDEASLRRTKIKLVPEHIHFSLILSTNLN